MRPPSRRIGSIAPSLKVPTRRPALRVVISTLVFLGIAVVSSAFICIQSTSGPCVHWTSGQAFMKSFLGTPGRTLLNGTTTWDENAVMAADDWNAQGASFHFDVSTGAAFNNPCGPRGSGHACTNTGPSGDNPIFFASDFCGMGFGDIIELTNNCYVPNSGALINAPVFVNSNVSWNAYDGRIQSDINGVVVYDIRRVLLHELGHVLGLDHPDAHGQHVTAIMNSHVSNLDRLQADDINGLFSLYPSGGGPKPQSPPPTSGCAVTPADNGTQGLLLIALALIFSRRARSLRSRRQ